MVLNHFDWLFSVVTDDQIPVISGAVQLLFNEIYFYYCLFVLIFFVAVFCYISKPTYSFLCTTIAS